MKNYLLAIIIFLGLVSCATKLNNKTSAESTFYNSIKIDTILNENLSIRAILIDKNKVWYAANKGNVGFINLDTHQKTKKIIIKDSLNLEFRSIAQTSKYIYILSIGNPALLYQITKDNMDVKLVYEENNPKVFYDSMQFWNDLYGIAIGDPTDDCLSLLSTHDGGNSWQKTSCENLPKTFEGEAAFAASNTNIVIKEKNTWLVTGGKKSRVFYSSDKGNSWKVFETPIVQGKNMTGIFTADFYDKQLGFIAGGNYELQKQNFQNKAITTNGGKTWDLISENQGFGYTSCVQYIPNSKGKELVSVGPEGLFYSSNGGSSWKQLSNDPDLYTIRFIDNHTAIGAGSKKIIRINFLK